VSLIAKTINYDKYNEWMRILKSLHRGEAVLAGMYTVNDNDKYVDTSIIVKVMTKVSD